MRTQVDIIEIYQRLLGKITKALESSDFFLCTNLSSEMIRVSDYIDFTDGIFLGEFLESLFMNLKSTNDSFIIEEEIIDNLKNDITNLITALEDSVPMSDAKKIRIYDLITDVRAKTSKLQLESFRGERKRKIDKKMPRFKLPVPDEIVEI